jgi:epoxide hydrolase-like predicted phosphatase
MYGAIIFDFFDVLHTDSYQAWLRNHGFQREGVFAEASRLLDRGSINMSNFYEKLSLASRISTKNIEAEFATLAKLDTDVVSLIKTLHDNYKLGLLSNADASHLRPILKKYELNSLFDKIIISSEVGVIKPEPDIFHIILNELGIKPANTIFIDDNEHNIKAAHALGIHGIWYQDVKTLRHQLHELGIDMHSA